MKIINIFIINVINFELNWIFLDTPAITEWREEWIYVVKRIVEDRTAKE
jgi:hypothetical protein